MNINKQTMKIKEHPQRTHRAPTEHAQGTRRAPTEHPQSTHRAPTEHPQSNHRAPTEHPQNTHRAHRASLLILFCKVLSRAPRITRFPFHAKTGFSNLLLVEVRRPFSEIKVPNKCSQEWVPPAREARTSVGASRSMSQQADASRREQRQTQTILFNSSTLTRFPFHAKTGFHESAAGEVPKVAPKRVHYRSPF